jgi:hypothetical protein
MNGQTRIESMFAYVAVDPADNTEGVVALGNFPLVGADLDRAVSLESAAQAIADTTGAPVTLVHFSQRTEGKTLTPRTPR